MKERNAAHLISGHTVRTFHQKYHAKSHNDAVIAAASVFSNSIVDKPIPDATKVKVSSLPYEEFTDWGTEHPQGNQPSLKRASW